MPDLARAFEQWLLNDQRLAERSAHGYANTIRALRRAKGRLDTLKESDLLAYQQERIRKVGAATWNRDRTAIQAFYGWLSRTKGVRDPSRSLKRRKEHPAARVVAAGLFARIASLPEPYRALAKVIYLTGLEPAQVRWLMKRRSLASEMEVPGRRGNLMPVRLEPRTQDLLRELRQSHALFGPRTAQRAFERAGVSAQEIRAAYQQDRDAPALALLVHHPELEESVAAELRSAHAHVEADPPRAIEESAKALEDMGKALGGEGDGVGDVTKSAWRGGHLGHDPKLAEAVVRMAQWVGANRVNRGGAHGQFAGSKRPSGRARGVKDDAWLALRVVEALVIRMVKWL